MAFQVNDLRGEYWLYTEGDLRVNVGKGWIDGACVVNTSDVHLEAGGPIDADRVASILAEFLALMGGPQGGFGKLMLYNDGQYDFTQRHFDLVDSHLRPLGFQLVSNRHGKELLWAK